MVITWQFVLNIQRSNITDDCFFPTYLGVASHRDAGSEYVLSPHCKNRCCSHLVATPFFLYGVIEIQHLRCCWKFSLLLNKSDDLKT